MMTVRFPNGQAVQYNNAMWLEREETGWVLKESKAGAFIAFVQASAGAIVEFRGPCRVYDGIKSDQLSRLETQVQTLTREIRSLKRKVAK
jgi:hypothetical protein